MTKFAQIFIYICTLIATRSFGQNILNYKTYSAILNEFLRQEGTKKDLIIIIAASDTTLAGGDPALPGLTAKLDSVMKKRVTFDNKFKINRQKSIVISEHEFYALTIDKNYDMNWDPLFKKYSNAISVITLSPIYYTNQDKTSGILQISISQNSLSGGVFFVQFDLTKRKKKRVKRTVTLVS